jgi:hypothetical protein
MDYRFVTALSASVTIQGREPGPYGPTTLLSISFEYYAIASRSHDNGDSQSTCLRRRLPPCAVSFSLQVELQPQIETAR